MADIIILSMKLNIKYKHNDTALKDTFHFRIL